MEKRLSTILVTMFCIAIGIVFIALVSINSFGLNNFTNPVIGQSYSDFENKIVFFDLDTFIKDKSINERYDYLKLAFALQGLVNRQQPLIYYKYTSGSLDGGSDNFWLQEIQQEGRRAIAATRPIGELQA